MNELISIDDKAFLKEYVWAAHASVFRGKPSTSLRNLLFRDWAVNNTKGHIPGIESELSLSE